MQILYNFLAIIIRILTNSMSNVFQKKLSLEDENPVVVNFINYFILCIFSIPLIFLANIPITNINFIIYALLGGLTGAICNCFMVLALKRGELSVLGPINSYKAIIGLIFGMIILHEFPNIFGLIGIAHYYYWLIFYS